ncbi:MAG: hypothetical protein NTZ48_04505, partial [Candidatus Omnitrophica bacterium]|nr:hypothetical protein [Candidatus Omnitrophota bacterium]
LRDLNKTVLALKKWREFAEAGTTSAMAKVAFEGYVLGKQNAQDPNVNILIRAANTVWPNFGVGFGIRAVTEQQPVSPTTTRVTSQSTVATTVSNGTAVAQTASTVRQPVIQSTTTVVASASGTQSVARQTALSTTTTNKTVRAKAAPRATTASTEPPIVSTTLLNKAPEYNTAITARENIAKRVAYYRGTGVAAENRVSNATADFWETQVFNPLKSILRNTQRAFVATDMLMFSFNSQYGMLPEMTNKGASIWQNKPLNGSSANLARNLVSDWTDKVIRNMRKDYSPSLDWQESLKEAIEKTGEIFSQKVELYFNW